MQAQWVEPIEAADLVDVQRPVYQLVGSFTADDVASAELRITAHGVYEAFLNGVRVGDQELTPGFTAYRKRLQVQRYDVTELVRRGDNALGVLLSDGWWRGQNGIGRRTNAYGDNTGVLAELTVVSSDGTRSITATDASWVFAPSHIEAADLVAGEVHDLRKKRDDWALPGADRSSWQPVRVADHGLDALCESIAPPVRRVQELPAVSVVQVAPGRHVVDFGQVSNGWIRLTELGPEGTRLTIVHGECLTPAGDDVQIEALAGGVNQHDPRWVPAFQTDVVVSAGDGSAFEPRHSTKGFRYVRIDGHPGPLEPSAITSIVVCNDVQPVGSFACSDDDLTWLHTAADWSLRTNLCDIPTDCPTRERAGWTGDWQIYVDTASYLYDVTDFSRKWLHDVVAEQLPSGAVLHFVPDPFDHSSAENGWWTDLQGSAGWGDAVVHVPWELYRATGRADVLAPYVEGMRRWVDFAADRASTGRHQQRATTRPDPASHERYLWDSGFHFGEWNEPENSAFAGEGGGQVDPESGLPGLAARLMAMDHGATATAFLYRSADELARIAEALGDDAIAARYSELAAHALAAWRTEFLVDGHVQPATQPNLVRALAFGLVPDDLRAQAAEDLAGLVRATGTHLGTGFLATTFLLPVLADHGHLDLAYEVLLQRTAPSWLAMRDQGATTIWEGWHPFDAEGKVKESLNHFSMGAVVGFLHRYVAGLEVLEPGYRRFRVAPRPGGGVTWANTHHDSPLGRIEVSWRVADGTGTVEVVVPEGATAEVVLPGRAPEVVTTGTHVRSWEVPALTQAGAGR
jgi:alpha-L-rhamnosidase